MKLLLRIATGIICSVILFAMDTFWSRTTDWLYGL